LFGAELALALRRRGTEVTIRDDRTLVDAVRRRDAPKQRRRISPRAAAVAVAILSASALTAAAAGLDDTERPADASWLVEGRVAVEIPARWVVQQITSGPGSARLQVVSPDVGSDAIHLTQSRVPAEQTLDEAAESLRVALGAEPDGVFVDFTWPDERASRAAITYREIRPDRFVEWTVLVEDGVRIAIGCQGAVGHAGPEPACDHAIGSAHAVGRK
jgi:type VII secretion-associated protein (TIGR03931 family)